MASPYFDSVRQTSGCGLSSATKAAGAAKSIRDAQAAGLGAVPVQAPAALGLTGVAAVGGVWTTGATMVAAAGMEKKLKATRAVALAPTEAQG